MRTLSHPLLPIALPILLSWVTPEPALGTPAKAVRLRGLYEYAIHPEQTPPLHSGVYSFDAAISDCLWVISYQDTSTLTNPGAVGVSATASYDGTNIYFVQYHSEGDIKKLWGDKHTNTVVGTVAKIYPGGFPPPEQFTLQRIWFAFAASCVLPFPSGKTRPPIFGDLSVFYDNTNFTCGYFWALDAQGPGSRQITLTNDGHFVERDRQTGKVHVFQYSRPYDKGFVQATGVWNQGTNIGDLFVAREFAFNVFAPKFAPRNSPEFNTKTAQFVKSYEDRCTVTNIDTVVMDKIPTPLPVENVLVVDRRLQNEGWSQLYYLTTNSWLPVDDPSVLARAQSTAKLSLEAEVIDGLGIKPAKRGLLRGLIWMFIALPPCVIAVKGIVAKLKTNKQKRVV